MAFITDIGVTWQMTLEGRGGGESNMGTKNFSLRSSQVKKEGHVDFLLFFLSIHHLNNGFEETSMFYLTLLISVVKTSILR